MFDRILVAVGGNGEVSLEPVRIGARLAAKTGAELAIATVRHSTPSVLGEPFYSESFGRRHEEAEHILSAARRVAEQEGATNVGVEVLEGDAADRIVSLSENGGFSLVVVGSRGRNRLQAAVLGSVSSAVAARGTVPVLVVPPHAAAAPNQTSVSEPELVDAAS